MTEQIETIGNLLCAASVRCFTRRPRPGKNLMTIQEGALAAGETSGNLGMYLGLGVKDDIVEPENEICE